LKFLLIVVLPAMVRGITTAHMIIGSAKAVREKAHVPTNALICALPVELAKDMVLFTTIPRYNDFMKEDDLKAQALEGFLRIAQTGEEDYLQKAMDGIDSLEASIDKKMLKFESLVVTGQRMANLLHEFRLEVEGDPKYDELVRQTKELIFRWEKEFKTDE
jgi:hypothetical protein